MNLMNIANGAIRIIKNNKEKILLGTGIAVGAGAAVAACCATIKAKDIIEEHKEVSSAIKEASELNKEYADSKDHKLDICKNYALTGAKMVKMYAPAIVLGATSVCCLVAQHKMMENKVVKLEETVAGLSAAYIAVDTAFKNYRKRVVDKYGEEEDYNLRHGVTKETISVETVDEKGKVKKHKEEISTVNDLDISDYAKFFTYDNEQFQWQDAQHHTPDWDANIRFLNCQQAYANQKLELQGYLFLNDVYDMLGLPRTKAGQVVGWIFDPENKNIDSNVSFGVFNPINHRTINGYEEECILLDFNVDGPIIDKICGMGDH